MRLWIVVVLVLIGVYAVDRQFYSGRYFGALTTIANKIWVASR